MNNKQLKKLLLKNGFKDIGGDQYGDMFETEDVCVFFHKRSNKRDISFAYSEFGYYLINNATPYQVIIVMTVFKAAKFSHADSGEISKTQFKFTVLEILKKTLESKSVAPS